MKTPKYIFLFIFITNVAYSQNLTWVKQIGGTTNDYGNTVKVDASGNVYTTGAYQGLVDFDPGASTYTLSSAGGTDIFVSKLDANGNFLWAKSLGGNGGDIAYSIAFDGSGNVYTVGNFVGTADFDPGIGVSNLTSYGGNDIFVVKLDAAGNFVWAKQMGGTLQDFGYSIALDLPGNIYLTGNFQTTSDFDPGVGTYTLTSNGNDDIFISKLDPLGNFVWANQIGGAFNDFVHSISLDGSGNVLTTGNFIGKVDFDPGVGIFNITPSGSSDIFVSKLNSSGNFVWAKNMGGSFNDLSYALTLDAIGNVYTTGLFTGTADFDPGVGTYTLTSSGGNDIFVSKLDVSGNFLWAAQMGGTATAESGFSIKLDGSGNVYTTGYFQGVADFDPGLAIYSLTSAGGFDIFISKLDVNWRASDRPRLFNRLRCFG